MLDISVHNPVLNKKMPSAGSMPDQLIRAGSFFLHTEQQSYTCTASLDLDLIVYNKPDEWPAVCYQFLQRYLISQKTAAVLGRRVRSMLVEFKERGRGGMKL